ncbi:MAG: dihydrofolate synthase/folylpolyglutamate synthase [Myxococcota bacterium]
MWQLRHAVHRQVDVHASAEAAIIRRLGALPRLGNGIGLERVARALDVLNLRLPPSIKVTGSNGKGSTAAMCAAVLRAHGLRVGLFTSPHYTRITERIDVDGPLDATAFNTHLVVAAAALGGTTYNRFELLTVAAAHAFAGAGVQYIVWEAGIGGRHDPTRLMAGNVAVLTQVARQHAALLGDMPEEIAANKADILDHGTLVVARDTAGLLKPRATHQVVVASDEAPPSNLVGRHQQSNARCAVAAVRALLGPLYAPNAAIRGLKQVRWPGRFETSHVDGVTMVIDAAHDPSSLAHVAETLWSRMGDGYRQPVVLVFGCSRGLPAADMLDAIAGGVDHVIMSSARHKGRPAEQLAALWRGPSLAIESLEVALAHARRVARAEGALVLVTGGLFLAAEATALTKNLEAPIFF